MRLDPRTEVLGALAQVDPQSWGSALHIHPVDSLEVPTCPPEVARPCQWVMSGSARPLAQVTTLMGHVCVSLQR